MGTSLADRAGRRASKVVEPAIRAALAAGDGRAALYEAIRALRSEAEKLRRHRPGDAALADAELAGSIAAVAAGLHAHKPGRPDGLGPRGIPRPEHLLATFEASLRAARGEDDSHE